MTRTRSTTRMHGRFQETFLATASQTAFLISLTVHTAVLWHFASVIPDKTKPVYPITLRELLAPEPTAQTDNPTQQKAYQQGGTERRKVPPAFPLVKQPQQEISNQADDTDNATPQSGQNSDQHKDSQGTAIAHGTDTGSVSKGDFGSGTLTGEQHAGAVSPETVEVLAIVPKSEAAKWLEQLGNPE